ncbi:hypothetical protein HK102_002590 [Quaeritorhiza haematococci]|nr:hypothetical protein HK102_002590 [Quaeritorhiza haematococci]
MDAPDAVALAEAPNPVEPTEATTQQPPRVCQFFASRFGCEKGDKCRFVHDQSESATGDNTLCAICFLEKRDRKGKKAGVLECQHTFCIKCITKWHKANKRCPICLKHSDYVVPLSSFPKSLKHLNKMVAAYKTLCAEKECKYYNPEQRGCPNGPQCLYAHHDQKGNRVIPLLRKQDPAPRVPDVRFMTLAELVNGLDVAISVVDAGIGEIEAMNQGQ